MISIIPSSRSMTAPKARLLVMFILVFAGLILPPPLFAAQPATPAEIALRLQKTYEKAGNLVAEFVQTTAMKFSGRVKKGSGTLIFMRPGRMRWDYLAPDQQVLISDGRTISMYFAKSRQMITSNARDYLQSDVTYSFFTGSGDIQKDFDIQEPDFENREDNTYLIKLVPKSTHPQVSFMHVWVNADNFTLSHLQIVDHFETVTDLVFYNMRIDANSYDGRVISQDTFSFTPPAGTEIIKQ